MEKWDETRPAEKINSLYSLLMFSRNQWSLKRLFEDLNCSKPSVLRLTEQPEGSRNGKILKPVFDNWAQKIKPKKIYFAIL